MLLKLLEKRPGKILADIYRKEILSLQNYFGKKTRQNISRHLSQGDFNASKTV